MLYRLILTSAGWIGMAGNGSGLARMSLPAESEEDARQALFGGMAGQHVESKHEFTDLTKQLKAYFDGRRTDFDCALDFGDSGDFDRAVWETAREIPYGQVRTYGWIADRIGRPHAPRAVGQALGRNPVPLVVPCHRVIRSDGTLGGFGCGLHWKVRLLELERVRVSGTGDQTGWTVDEGLIDKVGG